MPKITLHVPGENEHRTLDYQIQGSTFTIQLADQVFEGQFTQTGVGRGWLTLNDVVTPFYLTKKLDTLCIWLHGRTYTLELIDRSRRQSRGTSSNQAQSGDIKAPMPGTVLNVLVQPGDTVQANQPLVIMESMKMEMTLSSPSDSKVSAVHCQTGQLVDMGSLLVQLEPHESTPSS